VETFAILDRVRSRFEEKKIKLWRYFQKIILKNIFHFITIKINENGADLQQYKDNDFIRDWVPPFSQVL
jgi:hypothetical protein